MKLLFLLTLLAACCRLSGLVSEGSEVVVSCNPIEAAVGENVTLRCHLKPSFDIHNLTVEWRHNKTAVHIYRSRADDPDSQQPPFKDRTHLFHDEMSNGNISLKLFNVTKQDEGVYTCSVHIGRRLVKTGNINLKVVQKGNEDRIEGDPTSGPDTNTGESLSPAAISGIVVVIAFIAFPIGFLIGIVIKRKHGQQRGENNRVI